ncbi:MAG: DUF2061 domain-containing protein [Flavobacteriales bacterium]
MAKLKELRPSKDKFRHILKALSYRIYSTFITITIAALVTGNTALAFAIGGVDFTIKIFTYYLHERIWHYIPYGQAVAYKRKARAVKQVIPQEGFSVLTTNVSEIPVYEMQDNVEETVAIRYFELPTQQHALN